MSKREKRDKELPSSSVEAYREVKVWIPKRERQYVKTLNFEILLIYKNKNNILNEEKKKRNLVIHIRISCFSVRCNIIFI